MAAFFRRALAGETLRIDGDGRQVRNFVYVEDLAKGFVLALGPAAENQTINLDGRRPGVDPRARRARPRSWCRAPRRSSARLVRATSHRASSSANVPNACSAGDPEVDIVEGVRRTFDWYVAAHASPAIAEPGGGR